MSIYAYLVAVWLVGIGAFGIVRSRSLVHTVVCLSVAQSGTYVLLLAVGYQRHAVAPVFGSTYRPPHLPAVVDPVVQALTLTDVVVSATVTALLLAIALQIAKRQGTDAPDELADLQG